MRKENFLNCNIEEMYNSLKMRNVSSHFIKDLVNYLNELTYYYDIGEPRVSDEKWDELFFFLQKIEEETSLIYPNSPTQSISYQVVNELDKVQHNHFMSSLAKTKDWDEFLHYFYQYPGKSVIGMLKLDGLTCSLRYINGELVSAETRGDGHVGENILHNARVLSSIPQHIGYKNELVIDGEIICTYDDFKSFEDEYANPRNFASGSIRLLDSKECQKRKLTFVSWNIVKGLDEETNSFLSRLNELERLGFKVVPWVSSFDWDAKEYLIEEAKKLGYPIDGLVGRFDNVEFGTSLGETDHHSRAAYAFKFYDEHKETYLRDIEWGMGRTGVLTPVAIFDPIEMEGTIERASLHNISVMEDLLGKPFYGQKLHIMKANAIIPQVAFAEKDMNSQIDLEWFKIPEVCPVCSGPVKCFETPSAKILRCENLQCSGKLINRLDHFCGKTGLDIKGLSKATLEKFIEWGWVNCYADIFNLSNHYSEWIDKEGFGEKSVTKIIEAINLSKKCTLDKFLTALNIPLISSVHSKEVCKNIQNYEELRELVKTNFDFSEWERFGPERAKALLNYDYTEADNLYHNYLTVSNDLIAQAADNLKDLVFVITGTLNSYKNRNELKSIIEANGGRISTSVSKNTNYLINNNINSTSSKNKTAKSYNIPIITEEEFISKFLI